MEKSNKKYDKINYFYALESGRYSKETITDRNKYRNNEITILERFENYLKLKEYEDIKNQCEKEYHEDDEQKKIEREKERMDIELELIIYKFIDEHIFQDCQERNIITKKNRRNDKEDFLRYIKEQIILKVILEKNNTKSNPNINLSSSASFRESGNKYLQKKYSENVEWDDNYYRKKYSQFNKSGKNECLKQLKIFPEVIHFLILYNYKEDYYKKYINEKFFNIIKEVTSNKNRDYSLKDLVEFYNEFDCFVNISNKKEYMYTKCSVFERVFKGSRLKFIFKELRECKHTKLTNRKVLTLHSALEIKDLQLSIKYIRKILKTHSKLQRIFAMVLLYNKIYELIDIFIETVLKSNSVSFVGYDDINYNEKLNEEDSNEKSGEEDINTKLKSSFINEQEDIFLALKKLKNFEQKNKMIQKLKNKSPKLICYKDFEFYESIRLSAIVKVCKNIKK